MNRPLFLAFLVLASTVVAKAHAEESTEHEEFVPEIGVGSTIQPTNDSFNEFCKLKHENGDGTEAVERFYYDASKKACFNFTWSGGKSNENHFLTENDCLEKCQTQDTGEGVSLKETDVVLLVEPRSVDTSEQILDRCPKAPKSTAGCPDKQVQRFFYDEKLQACFAYKSCATDDGYAGRHDCESSCRPLDGSVCGTLQQEPIAATKQGQDCSTTTCPEGSTCFQGMIPQCCDDKARKVTDFLYGQKCLGGQQAAGKMEQYFLPTVAKSCADLLCDIGYECQTIDNQFGKCCPAKKKPSGGTVHRDSPLYEAFQQGWMHILK